MDLREFRYQADDLLLPLEVLEGRMGYPAGQCPEYLRLLIREALQWAEEHSEIQGGLVVLEPVSLHKETHALMLGGVELEIQKILFGQLRKADAIALFLCTAGPAIGARAEELMRRGDFLEGYILDLIGSEIVEVAMDQIQDTLERELALTGLHITNRFSPGYCGWRVAEQQKLFSFFPKDFCGVTLTEHSLMQPIKSVSGIIGIGKDVRRKAYACQACEMAQCIYRGRAATP
ncbi:MAG: hypothetical protein KIPDCIKN_01856 [Haliscomenobacter sp.]|nr:hypothetical protein [Haliscomenobacter sp.]